MTSHRHPLWCHSGVHFSTHVMCCTQDSVHFKAHSLQAVVTLCPSGREQSIVVEVRQQRLTYLLFTLQCPSETSRWGNCMAPKPWGIKRGNTFSPGNCVLNYAVWRAFLLPLCQCHALSPEIRASFHWWWLDRKFNKNPDRQAVTS